MIKIEVKTEGVEALIRKTRRFSRNALRGIEDLTDEQAEAYRQEVIRRASGRPGPQRVTGDYVSRFRIVKERIFRGFRTSVVNDHPASARLELGYTGVDAAGRTYNQPPFPHWRPAREVMAPKFGPEGRKRIARWWED